MSEVVELRGMRQASMVDVNLETVGRASDRIIGLSANPCHRLTSDLLNLCFGYKKSELDTTASLLSFSLVPSPPPPRQPTGMTSVNAARQTGHCINCTLTTFIQSLCGSQPPQLQLAARSSSLSHRTLVRSLSSGRQLIRKINHDEGGHRSEDVDAARGPKSGYRRISFSNERTTRRTGRHEPPQASRSSAVSSFG